MAICRISQRDKQGTRGRFYCVAEYFYLKNAQGDIEGILDTTGALVVSYTYDAWGKVLSCAGTPASTVGAINPMRYRDYYLDSETALVRIPST